MATARLPNVGGVGVVSVPGELESLATSRKPDPRSQPSKPGVIFKRSDSPFSGEGTHVTLSARAGVTKRGFLTVPFRFQIPPIDSWTRSFSGRWQNYDVVGDERGPRERSRFGGASLRTVNFRTMFMDWHPSWGVWEPDLLEPILAVRELESLARNGVVFALKVRNDDRFVHDDVNMLATILQGDVEENAAEPDTRYITLSFQEFDELEAKRQSRVSKSRVGTEPGVRVNSTGASHTIKAGDTLYSLARYYYRAQTEWRTIANANAGMENWPPSRPLTEWRAQTGNKRVKIPGLFERP